jgi:hypothetical protein
MISLDGRHLPKYRADATSDGPDATNRTVIGATIPHADHVPDADVDQAQEAATADALDGSSGNEHVNVDTERTDERSDEEDDIGDKQDGFAAENVGDFAPWRR